MKIIQYYSILFIRVLSHRAEAKRGLSALHEPEEDGGFPAPAGRDGAPLPLARPLTSSVCVDVYLTPGGVGDGWPNLEGPFWDVWKPIFAECF